MSRENTDDQLKPIAFPIQLDPFVIEPTNEGLVNDRVDASNGHDVEGITSSLSKMKLETIYPKTGNIPSRAQSDEDEIGKSVLIISRKIICLYLAIILFAILDNFDERTMLF